MSIKVGDLVMVVKPTPCCKSPKSLGRILVVEAIRSSSRGRCPACGDLTTEQIEYLILDGALCFKSRVIKIDPPSLPESLEREKELSV